MDTGFASGLSPSLSQHRIRVHASVGPSSVKEAHTTPTQHTGPQTRQAESNARCRGDELARRCTRSLLRAVDGTPNPGRGDDVADDHHLAARRMRKICSAKNFLRDHEFFVVANITARKFGWTRVFPVTVGPAYRLKLLASALPDGATDLITSARSLSRYRAHSACESIL